MSTFQFTPKSDEPLPAGNYRATVFKLVPKTAKASGNPMLEVSLGIHNGDDALPFPVTDYLLESSAYKLRHFCQCVGADYETGTIDCEGIEAAAPTVWVKLEIEEAKDRFKAKNKVRDYLPGAAGSASQTRPVEETVEPPPPAEARGDAWEPPHPASAVEDGEPVSSSGVRIESDVEL